MKRSLLVFLFLGIALLGHGTESSFLTDVIYHPTAYTLPTGIWELRARFSLLSLGIPSVSLDYGLNKTLEVGTGLTADLMGFPNLGAKLFLGWFGPVALAFLGNTSFSISEGSLYLGTGVAMSTIIGPLGVHAGTHLAILPNLYFSSFIAADYGFIPNARMLAEMSLPSLATRLGLLFRLFDILSLKAWSSLFPFSLGASLGLRF